ncbi:uncharacterized protein [Euphorbia lathyris]|uniref:uncharacterized protein isoform X3 n=1 Tax=Euphorbia lathyris TaxID=212925 RepID=UPI0033138D00
MSLARHLKMNKKKQEAVVGNKESNMVQKGTEDLDENQFSGNHENAKIEKDNQEDTIFQENMEISSDQDGQIGKEHGLEDASPHDVDGESMSNIDLVNRERELNIPVPLGVDGVVDTQISGGFQ